MKIGIIIGSHRPKSESTKVGRYIEGLLKAQGSNTYFCDLAGNPLPLWDEGAWQEDSKISELWKPYGKELKSCDGFVVVSPEWAGMVPAGLKNFFLFCGHDEVSHKPALIITVSASTGGAYPVVELRSSSYKNSHLCYIPEHVIVRNVRTLLNDPDGAAHLTKEDLYIRGRLNYATKLLNEYSKAFTAIRGSGVINHKEYPYGM